MKLNHKGAAASRLPLLSSILPVVFSIFLVLSGLSALQTGGRSFSSDIKNRNQRTLAPEEMVLQVFLHPIEPLIIWISAPLPNSFAVHSSAAKCQSAVPDLTAHEWGTFTSIAGNDGQAMDWLPLTGSTDVPSFVEHFRNISFKGGLRGTVRMETPVLYFYSPRETTVSVKVSFAKGLITEWFPHASAVPSFDSRRDFSLFQTHTQGSITWNSVHIEPSGSYDFRRDEQENHYYAARETASAPLRITTPGGEQREKFLFYRGVSAFTSPISASLTHDGAIHVQNNIGNISNCSHKSTASGVPKTSGEFSALAPVAQCPQENNSEIIPNLILFERRGDKVGYRLLGPLRDQDTFAFPELSDSLDSLFNDLERILITQGLYSDEAHTMIETWKNSWFEEGARLFYIVPRSFVDSVLPLTISPAPSQITRVFVGRIELITPGTQQAVESAFASNDRATLATYGRFLEPILSSLIQNSPDLSRQRRLLEYLNSLYAQTQVSTP